MRLHKNYPCPCCGYLTFSGTPGSFEICEICGWEDDGDSLLFPGSNIGGPNPCSLLDAQKNFQTYGVFKPGWRFGRQANADDKRDPGWFPLTREFVDSFPSREIIEDVSEQTNKFTFAEDLVRLYYWRPNFILRKFLKADTK
jgi:hypothetical protein